MKFQLADSMFIFNRSSVPAIIRVTTPNTCFRNIGEVGVLLLVTTEIFSVLITQVHVVDCKEKRSIQSYLFLAKLI